MLHNRNALSGTALEFSDTDPPDSTPLPGIRAVVTTFAGERRSAASGWANKEIPMAAQITKMADSDV
ncbi:MAG: hypothetical protein IH914_01385 [candidate division Zixibacteria bacterium]|nr:hypothetical protein [candidate division Zixibacteria bacterium]